MATSTSNRRKAPRAEAPAAEAPAAQPPAKPAAKKAAKPVAKAARKPAAKPVAESAAPAQPAKSAKSARPAKAKSPAVPVSVASTVAPVPAPAPVPVPASAPAKTVAKKAVNKATKKGAPAVTPAAGKKTAGSRAKPAGDAESTASAPPVAEPSAPPVVAPPAAPVAPAAPEAPAARVGQVPRNQGRRSRPAEAKAAPSAPAPAPAPAPAARASAPKPTGRRDNGRRDTGRRAAVAAPIDPVVAETAQAVLAVLSAESAPAAAPSPAPAPRPTGPAHSALLLVGGDRRAVAWQPGHACPPALLEAAAQRLDADGHLPDEDDTALPLLLRLAAEAHHPLQVSEAVWAHRAAHRDARHRLGVLEAAYPDGPASAALQHLLRAPLPLFQAEGALFAVVAGRALLADERGLGKGVQAIAAATLWQRHFGVQRVLVLCAPAQRLAWQRAWQRFAGAVGDETAAQVIDGGLHQRQAQWSAAAGVRIIAPDALDSDAAHLAHWAPDLVIVDEPQGLGLRAEHWAALQSPYALVLCGAPLADEPELMHTLVAWLDEQRLGPLAALVELQSASDTGRALTEADIERLTSSLSRLMLQRLRADLVDQLPPLVHTERLVPLAPGQRVVHDQQAAIAQRALAGWRASGYLSDTEQWRLASALRAMQQACHRADPADATSALAESSLQALAAQLAEWAATGAARVAVLCPTAADQALLAERLAEWLQPSDGGLQVQLIAPGEPLPGGLDAVLQVGVPWRPRRNPAGPRGEASPGQQWVYLVAQDSLEAGLFDTLASRSDAPRGLDDTGSRDYLHGQALADWLQAVQAALPPA